MTAPPPDYEDVETRVAMARHLARLSFFLREARSFLDRGDFAACVDKLGELRQVNAMYKQDEVAQLRQEALDRLHERASQPPAAGGEIRREPGRSSRTSGTLPRQTSTSWKLGLERESGSGTCGRGWIPCTSKPWSTSTREIPFRGSNLGKRSSSRRRASNSLIHFQGRGGNGIYTYYWNEETVAGPLTNEGYTFEVHSVGAAIIGTGKVVSGDGQTVERELYIRVPDCFQ